MERRCFLLGRLFGPLCCGCFLFVLLILDGSAVFQTYAVDVEVKDEANITCLIAKWMMNFSVSYESSTSVYKDASFVFPNNVTYHGSTCGNKTYGPILAIQFGKGNSWTITFAKTEDSYQGNISFTYNTDDVELFPDAKRKGPITAFASYPKHSIPLNAVYSCQNVASVEADHVVQAFWNVTLQAYMENGSLSEAVSRCHDDTSAAATATMTTAITTTTTAAITTTATAATTHSTMTATIANTSITATTANATINATTANTTTSAVTTNGTSATPTHLPTVEPGKKPITGNYSVKRNGTTACLLANIGLQLNISQENQGPLIMNINPNTTVVNGSCSDKTAVLQLNDANTTMIDFMFAVTNASSGKFYLKEVAVTVMDPLHRMRWHAENGSLDYWKAFLGSSYMCQREQTLVLNRAFSINTFDVWIQPFLVKENVFSTAEDCHVDVDNYFVPIFVGMALAGLLVLVLMAYFVGRKHRHYTGYEQF